MSAFAWSFLAGLAVIFLFAWDQFNHKSWKAQRKFALMLSVLSPADLRGGAALRRAFLIYATILSVVYAACVFLLSIGVIAFDPKTGGFGPEITGGGSLPAAVTPGETPETAAATATPDQPAAPGTDERPGPEPWVPLAISLAMVGLAPRAPIFARGEERLRALTHALMGIPSALSLASRDIAQAPLSLDQIGADRISGGQRERLQRYLAAAESVLGQGAWVRRLERSIMKILAFKIWVLEQEIFPATPVRERYALIEEDVSAALDGLFDDLDDLCRRSEAEPVSEQKRPALAKRWENRIKASADLGDDVCALMFVYYEKSAQGSGDAKVMEYLQGVLRSDRSSIDLLNMLLLSVMAAVGLAFFWGYAEGILLWLNYQDLRGIDPSAQAPSYSASTIALLFAVTSFLIYGPATMSAVFWRHSGAVEAGCRVRTAQEAQVFPAMRMVGLFLASAGITCLALVLFNIANAALAVGIDPVAQNLKAVIVEAVRQELPRSLLGGVQGVFIARQLDLSIDDLAGRRAMTNLALHGLSLALCAAIVTDMTQATRALQPIVFSAAIAGLIGWVSNWTLLSAMRKSLLGPERYADVLEEDGVEGEPA